MFRIMYLTVLEIYNRGKTPSNEDNAIRYINMIGKQNWSWSPIFKCGHLSLECFVANLKVENLRLMALSGRDFENEQNYLEVVFELTKFAYR